MMWSFIIKLVLLQVRVIPDPLMMIQPHHRVFFFVSSRPIHNNNNNSNILIRLLKLWQWTVRHDWKEEKLQKSLWSLLAESSSHGNQIALIIMTNFISELQNEEISNWKISLINSPFSLSSPVNYESKILPLVLWHWSSLKYLNLITHLQQQQLVRYSQSVTHPPPTTLVK